jgi:hypothetical protein
VTGPAGDYGELLARASEFLHMPEDPAEPVLDTGAVIAAEGKVRADAEPFLRERLPVLPAHNTAVVADDGDDTCAGEPTEVEQP